MKPHPIPIPNTPPEDFTYAPPAETPNTIFCDDHILLVSKPSGLLSVPGKGGNLKDCLEKRVQNEYPSARIVHRLDMDTSGIMVFGMNKDAHKHLGRQFEKRAVEKSYIAVVNGHVLDDAGEVDLPLRCDWENRPKQMVDFEHGRNALTKWSVVKRNANKTTCLTLYPHTGRSHQLRVHTLYMGHPIVGDSFYGEQLAVNKQSRLHLHAHTLCFYHPNTNERVNFEDPCPF